MTLNYQIKSILNCLSIQYANSVSFFTQLDALPKDEKLVGELRSGSEPHIFEAGLDPDDLHCNGKLLIDGLIMYQVIDKRKPELDELAKGIIFVFSGFFNKNSRKLITITYIYSALNYLGMEEVFLVTFLKRTPALKDVVFPVDAERYILAETVLNILTYENKDASEENKNC